MYESSDLTSGGDRPERADAGAEVGTAPSLVGNGDFSSLGGWSFNSQCTINDSSYKYWAGFRESSDCGGQPPPCYRISYPTKTTTNGQSFGEIRADFEVPSSASYALNLRVRDDYTGGRIGFYYKQVVIDDKLVWEGDVANDGSDWESLPCDVTEALKGKSSATISLRVALKAVIHDSFGISVWWDDVTLTAGPE